MLDIPVEVKELFSQDSVLKNYHIHFPNGECRDLESYDMESESVEFTESICSQNSFALGLNERSSISFDVHNIPNVKNCEIEVTLQIDVRKLVDEWVLTPEQYEKVYTISAMPELYELYGIEYFYYYSIPIGVFVIEECQKQSDMTIRRITAYTKELKFSSGYCNPLELAKYDVTNYRRIGIKSETSKFKMNITNFALSNIYTNYYPDDTGDVGNFVSKTNENATIAKWTARTIGSNTKFRELTVYLKGISYDFKTENNISLYRFHIPKSINGRLLRLTLKNMAESAEELGFGEYVFKQTKSIPYDKTTASNKLIDRSRNYKMFEDFSTGDGFENYLNGGIFTNATSTIYLKNYIFAAPYFGFSSSEISEFISDIGYLFRFGIVTSVKFVEKEYDYDISLVGQTIIDKTIKVQNDQDECYIVESKNEPGVYEDGITNLFNSDVPFVNRYFELERIKSPSELYMPTMDSTNFTNYISSWLEVNGFNSIVSRTGGYRVKECATKTSIYPNNSLYPEDILFPQEADISFFPGNYVSAWCDDLETKQFRYIYYVYNKIEGTTETKGYTIYDILNDEIFSFDGMDSTDLNVDSEHYSTYELSENKFVTEEKSWKNMTYDPYTNVASALKMFYYIPATIDSVGLPYLEAGDCVDVNMRDEEDSFSTIVLRRTLKGIQSLRDSYESK